MSDPIILVLPLPPSANRLWTNNHLSSDYKAWKMAADWEGRTQMIGIPMIEGKFTAKIEVPYNRRDLDNHCKAILDLCQDVGAIKNDWLAEEIHMYRIEREGVLVELTGI